MAINKRLIAIIRNRWALLLGSIILCTISVAFLVVSMCAGNALKIVIDDFMNRNTVEDASFMVQTPLSENNIEKLGKKYDIIIEQMNYYDIEYAGKTIRLLEDTENINHSSIKEGRDIKSSQEILIDENFAKSNSIEINDSMELENDNFNVVGFFARPDYATPVKSSSDSLIDEDFGVALTKSGNIPTDRKSSYYAITYNKNNQTEVRETLYKDYGLINYLAKENNARISTPSHIATGVTQMAYIFAPVLFLLTAVFCIIIIIKILKYDKSTIGILYAVGYKKSELLNFYLKLFYFISIVSSIIGISLGILLSAPICDFYASMGNIPNISFDALINWKAILLGFTVPITILTLAGIVVVNKYLKQDVIVLLRNQVKIGRQKKTFKASPKHTYLSNRIYSFRTLIRNKGRLIAFMFSVFLATAIILMGLIMKSSVSYIYDNQLQKDSSYKYLYILNGYYEDELTDGEGLVSLSWEIEQTGNTINVIGIQPNSEYFNLSMDKSTLNLSNGFYISNLLAKTLNIETNDKIVLNNPISLEKYEISVRGIVDIDDQKTIYTSKENLNELVGNEEDEYNSFVTNNEINQQSDRVVNTVRSSELLNSIKSSLTNSVLSVVNVLVMIGIGIGIIVIYMITSMTVEESESNITMLKVLGYTDKEITKMIFSGYKYLILLIYIPSIPVILYFCKLQFLEEANSLNMLIHARIQPDSIALGLLFIFLSYYIAMWASKKPIQKISMIESLKKNRE